MSALGELQTLRKSSPLYCIFVSQFWPQFVQGGTSLSSMLLVGKVGSIACSSQSCISERHFFLHDQIWSTKYQKGTQSELSMPCLALLSSSKSMSALCYWEESDSLLGLLILQKLRFELIFFSAQACITWTLRVLFDWWSKLRNWEGW